MFKPNQLVKERNCLVHDQYWVLANPAGASMANYEKQVQSAAKKKLRC
jgi:hypothetical protein